MQQTTWCQSWAPPAAYAAAVAAGSAAWWLHIRRRHIPTARSPGTRKRRCTPAHSPTQSHQLQNREVSFYLSSEEDYILSICRLASVKGLWHWQIMTTCAVYIYKITKTFRLNLEEHLKGIKTWLNLVTYVLFLWKIPTKCW